MPQRHRQPGVDSCPRHTTSLQLPAGSTALMGDFFKELHRKPDSAACSEGADSIVPVAQHLERTKREREQRARPNMTVEQRVAQVQQKILRDRDTTQRGNRDTTQNFRLTGTSSQTVAQTLARTHICGLLHLCQRASG
eukprot:149165-Chlamydomonas_euryale.AAC.3